MFKLQPIKIIHLFINNSKQIGLQFKHNYTIEKLIKSMPNTQWSTKHNAFYIKNTKQNLNLIYQTFKNIAWIDGSKFYTNKKINNNPKLSINDIKYDKKDVPQSYIDKLLLKNYAQNTCHTYISLFQKFLDFNKNKPINSLNENDIRQYLKHLKRKNLSSSYLNQSVNAIKFYYEVVMQMPNRFYNIERPRKQKSLPKVISKQEVARILKSTNNIKHKCIISLLYSSGLRKSELLNLELTDINSDNLTILVRNAKGGKDRITIISKSLLLQLREYYKQYKPKKYLFEGPFNKQYSPESVSKIVHKYTKKAGIKKRVTPHMLRHSFATHLLESGTGIRTIQSLLGHNSLKTTEIYTHIATNSFKNIINPLDSLDL